MNEPKKLQAEVKYMEDWANSFSDEIEPKEKPDLECPAGNWDSWIDTLYCV
jgi:hypothetical protein